MSEKINKLKSKPVLPLLLSMAFPIAEIISAVLAFALFTYTKKKDYILTSNLDCA